MPKKIFYSYIDILAKISIMLFCIVGILDTFFLVYGELFLKSQCVSLKFIPNSCDFVIKSEYGTFLGVPLALIGFIGYSSLFGFITLSFRQKKFILPVIFGSFLGLLASIYLTYLQGFVLFHWCFLCLLSAGSITIIFLSASFLAFFGQERINIQDDYGKIFQKSSYLFLFILAVTLAIFESLQNRKLLQETQTERFTLHKKCQLFSYPYPYATIGNQLITTQELDLTILVQKSPICQKINNLRMHALNMLLIEKEMLRPQKNKDSKKEDIYRLFFQNHQISFPRDHKITNIISFIEALNKIDDKERSKIEKEFSILRVKHKVMVNDFQ